MPRAQAGVLVECDASIKAIIVNIDRENGNKFIIEDIDDEHVLIQASKHEELKSELNKKLKDTVREPEESESE
ncbi:hypothetical protein Q7P35_004945 [Cladosporium inversicolor]